MRATWGLSGGLQGRESWAQKREDARMNARMDAENTRILESMNEERLLAEQQTQEKLDELNNLPAGAPDQKRLQEQYKQEKANLISSMAKYGGDVRKWMLTEGNRQLGDFKRNFESSDAYRDALTNKGSVAAMTEAMAKGAYIRPVTVRVKDDEGNIVTKKMAARDAMDAYQKGEILSMDGVNAEGKIKIDWNDPWFVNNALQSDGSINRVTADDLMAYMRTRYPEASQEQRMEIANEYANYVNEGLKKGEDRGFIPQPSDREKWDTGIAKFNLGQEAKEAQMNTQIGKYNQDLGRYSYSEGGSQRTGTRGGGRTTQQKDPMTLTSKTKNDIYSTSVTNVLENPHYVGGDTGNMNGLPNFLPPAVAKKALEFAGFQPMQYAKGDYDPDNGTPDYKATDIKVVLPSKDDKGNKVVGDNLNDYQTVSLRTLPVTDFGDYTYFTDENGRKMLYRKAYTIDDSTAGVGGFGGLNGVLANSYSEGQKEKSAYTNYVWVPMPDPNSQVTMDAMSQELPYTLGGSTNARRGRDMRQINDELNQSAKAYYNDWIQVQNNGNPPQTEQEMNSAYQYVQSQMNKHVTASGYDASTVNMNEILNTVIENQ